LKSSSTVSSATGTPTAPVQAAEKRATLKEKIGKDKAAHASSSKGVLGDVDYVTLMMGGRRKAKEEAEKLHMMHEC